MQSSNSAIVALICAWMDEFGALNAQCYSRYCTVYRSTVGTYCGTYGIDEGDNVGPSG